MALDCGAKVIAIEPSDTAQELRANLALNSYVASVFHCAVADRNGQMGLGGPDQVRQHLVVGAEAGSRSVEVRMLDDLVGDQPIWGVKIDVEGAERLVLDGARRLLRERRVFLYQVEWNEASVALLGESREPIAKTFHDHGYRLMRPDDRGGLRAITDIGFGPDIFAIRMGDEGFASV